MALAGAWVTAGVAAGLPPNKVRLSGRTFGALGDAAIIGLNGDGGADTGAQLPATFPGTAGDGQGVPTGAQLADRVEVNVVASTDPSSAAGVDLFQVGKGTAPYRVTLTLRGSANPTAPVTADVYLTYNSR